MKTCPRNIDKGIRLFGLEIIDLSVVFLVMGVFQLFCSIFIILVAACISIIVLRRIKQGKPDGYLQHLAHRAGMRYPGIIPSKKDGSRYAVW